jgi:Leucine-rich repeat (LRR) protein
MQNALESENQVADAGGVGALKPGVTVDLSRNNIQVLPEEVVDIVKNELERSVLSLHYFPPGTDIDLLKYSLALSHNQLSSLPTRFSECASLRYLNIRANQISEFPMPVRLCSGRQDVTASTSLTNYHSAL